MGGVGGLLPSARRQSPDLRVTPADEGAVGVATNGWPPAAADALAIQQERVIEQTRQLEVRRPRSLSRWEGGGASLLCVCVSALPGLSVDPPHSRGVFWAPVLNRLQVYFCCQFRQL